MLEVVRVVSFVTEIKCCERSPYPCHVQRKAQESGISDRETTKPQDVLNVPFGKGPSLSSHIDASRCRETFLVQAMHSLRC